MKEFALLVNGKFAEIRVYGEKPSDIPHKYITWYDVVRRYGDYEFSGLEGEEWVVQSLDPQTLTQVPYSITPRQCRVLLLQRSMLANVEQMISEQDEATRITWEYALEFQRDDPLLIQLATNLGLTSQQIDEFFIAASKL